MPLAVIQETIVFATFWTRQSKTKFQRIFQHAVQDFPHGWIWNCKSNVKVESWFDSEYIYFFSLFYSWKITRLCTEKRTILPRFFPFHRHTLRIKFPHDFGTKTLELEFPSGPWISGNTVEIIIFWPIWKPKFCDFPSFGNYRLHNSRDNSNPWSYCGHRNTLHDHTSFTFGYQF